MFKHLFDIKNTSQKLQDNDDGLLNDTKQIKKKINIE